jgi:preprotein translocase subunit SecD
MSMKTVSDLIRQSDPLRDEPSWSPQVRCDVRQTVLQRAADVMPAVRRFRHRVAVAVVTVSLVLVAGAAIIPRVWAPLVQAQASVRFEMRLAEDSPAPGLQPVTGASGTIYLHRDAVIGNSDIAAARVMTGNPAGFGVEVTFTPRGAEKIAQATRNHVGKSVAILIDGHVVATPRLRSALGSSAEVNGNFSRSDAERIAKGTIGR